MKNGGAEGGWCERGFPEEVGEELVKVGWIHGKNLWGMVEWRVEGEEDRD